MSQSSEQNKAQNSKVFSNLVSTWKVEFGNIWFTNNYCRFFLGFEEEVANSHSWRDHLSQLSTNLSQSEKQLIAIYDELLHAYEIAYQKRHEWWLANNNSNKQREFLKLYDQKTNELDLVLNPLKVEKKEGEKLLQAIFNKDPIPVKKILLSWKRPGYMFDQDINSEFSKVGLFLSEIKLRTFQIFPLNESNTIDVTPTPLAPTLLPGTPLKSSPSHSQNTPERSNQDTSPATLYFLKNRKLIFTIAISTILAAILISQIYSLINSNTPLKSIILSPNSAEYKSVLNKANSCDNYTYCIDAVLEASYPKVSPAMNIAKSRIFNDSINFNVNIQEARQYNSIGLDELKLKNNSRKAEEYFELAKKLNPQDAEIVANLAFVYMLNEKYNQAEKTSYQAIALHPQRVFSWIPLAKIYVKNNKPLRATQALLVAYEFSNNKPKILSDYINNSSNAENEALKKVYRDAANIIQTE